jgi:hypothetical protein
MSIVTVNEVGASGVSGVEGFSPQATQVARTNTIMSARSINETFFFMLCPPYRVK